jgi:prepilin-type N-terminal cleavage/methylation domain-containing protein
MKLGSRAGLTLIELVIAIAITGAVAALGYRAFSSLIDARAVIRTATIETERAAALRETLSEWLATRQVGMQTDRRPSVGWSGASDPLVLSSTFRQPAFMRLFIDDDPATPEHGLTMEYRMNYADTVATRELEPLVAGLQVEFLDERTNRWYPAREAATIQPLAVRVTLEGTEEAPLPPLLRLPLVAMFREKRAERPT